MARRKAVSGVSSASQPRSSAAFARRGRPSPRRTVPSPRRNAASPPRNALSPRGNFTPPRGKVAAPRRVATAPRGKAASRRGIFSSPRGNVLPPQGNATSPRSSSAIRRGAVPDRRRKAGRHEGTPANAGSTKHQAPTSKSGDRPADRAALLAAPIFNRKDDGPQGRGYKTTTTTKTGDKQKWITLKPASITRRTPMGP